MDFGRRAGGGGQGVWGSAPEDEDRRGPGGEPWEAEEECGETEGAEEPPWKRWRATPTQSQNVRHRGRGNDGGQAPSRSSASALTEVLFDNVPIEYSQDTMQEMHEAFELGVGCIASSDFRVAESTNGSTCQAVLRYTDASIAERAVQELDGQPVANGAGETIYLAARVMAPARGKGSKSVGKSWTSGKGAGKDISCKGAGKGVASGFGQDLARNGCNKGDHLAKGCGKDPARNGCNKGDHFAKGCGKDAHGFGGDKGKAKGRPEPPVIYPSVYVSDVPSDWTEAQMRLAHEDCDLDPGQIRGVKFLPGKVAAEFTSCIVRYATQEEAEKACERLIGLAVKLSTGDTKTLGARIAKPAKWMLELSGVRPADDPSEDQACLVDPNAVTKCDEGDLCIGRAGLDLIRDTVNGLVFCEACWKRYDLMQAPNIDLQTNNWSKQSQQYPVPPPPERKNGRWGV